MPSNFVAKGVENYEASMGRWSQRLAGPFLAFVGVPPGGRVLDAGAGTGSLTLALAAHFNLDAIEALDFAEDYVSALRARTADPRVTVRQGDVCDLPYEDSSFQAAYSLLVLHFVTDANRAIGDMRRVLRPGGLAGAAVWAWNGIPSWRLFWDAVFEAEPEAAKPIAPVRRPMTEEGELRIAFHRAGFKEVAETKLNMFMDFADFDDFWYPTAFGQGRFGAFYDGLPPTRRNRLQDAVRASYLSGAAKGRRRFPCVAWAVRGVA